jgi:acyl carrier protein
MDETFEKVKGLMTSEFDLAPDRITPSTELAALNVDSLATLEFIFTLETAFGITVDNETDLRGGKVQDVVDAVNAALSRRTAQPSAA